MQRDEIVYDDDAAEARRMARGVGCLIFIFILLIGFGFGLGWITHEIFYGD